MNRTDRLAQLADLSCEGGPIISEGIKKEKDRLAIESATGKKVKAITNSGHWKAFAQHFNGGLGPFDQYAALLYLLSTLKIKGGTYSQMKQFLPEDTEKARKRKLK